MIAKESLEEIKQQWQPYYDRELTLQDAETIVNNLGAFFQFLIEEANRQGIRYN